MKKILIEKIGKIFIYNLAKMIKNQSPSQQIIVASNLIEITKLIKKYSVKNDLIITMGAGNINTIWELLTEEKKPNSFPTNSIAA